MGAYDELKKNLGTTQPVITPKTTTAPSTVVSPSVAPTSAFQALKQNLASAPSVAPAPVVEAPARGVLGTVADAYGSYANMTRRVATNIFAGQAATVGSIASGFEWLGWKSAGKGATVFNDMAKWASPPDPTFTDHLLQGVGSVSTFFVPAIGVLKGANMIGKVSPALAMLFGNSSATALEALSEAGSVYDMNKKSGMSESEASSKATNTFWANAVLVGLSNKFGIFGDSKTILKKAVASVITEGGQEAGQQIISNLNTGRPWNEGVKEAGLIGGILGGGIGAGVSVATAMPPLKPKSGGEAPDQRDGKNPSGGSQDFGRPSIDLQKSLETQITNQNGESTTQEAPVSPSLPQQQNPVSQSAPAVETPQVNIPQTAPLVIAPSPAREVKGKDANRNTNERNTQEIVMQTLEGLREDQRISDQKNLSIARDYPANKIKKSAKPESIVKVYRAGTSINEGDHVTLDRANAEKYASQREGAKVVELKVPLRDLVFSQGIKSEFIYAPKPKLDPKLAGKKMTVEKGALAGVPVTDAKGNPIKRTALDHLKENLKPKGIVTDTSEVQKIRNAIAEGQNILRAGKSNGKKLKTSELLAVRQQVERDLAKIGESRIANAKKKNIGATITDVTPEGYGVEETKTTTSEEAKPKVLENFVPLTGKDTGEILTAPTEKSIYGKAIKLIVGKVKGGSFLSDSGILEYTDMSLDELQKVNSNTAELTADQAKFFQPVMDRAAKADTPLLASDLAGFIAITSYPILRFEVSTGNIDMQARYFNYLSAKYKDLELLYNPKDLQAPLRIVSKGKDVGVVMPTLPDKSGKKPEVIKAVPASEARAQKRQSQPSINTGSSKASFGDFVDENNPDQPKLVDAPTKPDTFDSVGEFQDGTPIKLGEYDNVKPIEFPELVALSKELMGEYPKIVEEFRKEGKRGDFTPEGKGRIRLVGSLFEKKNLGQLQKTLAHEIGHLIDWLPNKVMARGNLLGRLNTLSSFRKDFLPNQYRVDSELREQMYKLSKYWRPYNEETAPASFVSYRKSAEEVYADFISALFNNPLLVQDMAPSAYNLFFQQLDAKPEVKRAYFELQDLLRNGAEVVARRKDKAKNMFDHGDQVAKERQVQLEQEEDAKQKSIWFKFKFQYVDITERVKELKAQMLKEGRTLNPEDDPTYYLEERNYLGGKIRALVDEKFNGIYQQLQANDMSWEDLGEMMMYERILLGDRGEVANPEGLQPEFVQELYGDIGKEKSDTTAGTIGQSSMQTLLGDEKFNKLKLLAQEFRANLKEVFEEGYNEGLYSESLHKIIEGNDYYVPFRPIKYSAEKSRFGVMKQVGTLQQIENPANTAIEKAVAITRAIERNKVARKTIGFLQKEFSSEVEDAKLAFNGKVQIPQEPKKGSGQGLVTYHEGGKVKGFYVDEYISDAIAKNTTSQNGMLIEALQTMNSTLFRPLFITFNLGFQSFNLVRDFSRFWKNIPDMTILKAASLYRKSFRAARIRGFGLPENPSVEDLEANLLLNKLEREQMISVTFNDLIRGEEIEDRQIDRILRETGVRKAEPTKLGVLGEKMGVDRNSPVIKQAITIMDWIESTGNLIETLPKVAGRFALEGKVPPREMRSYIRKYLGSPDFLAGGKFKPVINEVFLFANAIFQGIRADYEIASQPKTRSAYWWKTTQANILPKMLMLAATAGLLGEWLKDVFGKMSEYDKTNYITVPLGIDENGRAIYFRVPQDETGRLLSGLFWKVGSAVKDPEKLADMQTYTNLLAYAGGQTPSISPAITASYNVSQFVAGDNPYDFFRQRSVLTDDQMAAGGTEKLKPFAMYMFNQLGGGVFMKVYVNETVPKEKTLGERIITLPIASNIAGRFIKITNYGEVEQLKEVQKEIRSEKAREGLANRRIVFEYVQKSQGVSYGEKQKIKQDMLREIYDGLPKTKEDRLQARSLERRFELLRLRGSADAQLDALLIAQSNDEKIALLQSYQKTMTKTEFEELRKFIIRNKVVSSDAYAQFIRSK